MKVRIKTNSVRYRLTRSDVATLVKNRHLEDSVNFGLQKLVYDLQIVNDERLSATFNNNTISLFMPKAMIMELAETDKVGFENTDGELYLLVEKDFTCLENIAEDQSDNYPNPLAEKAL